MRGLMGSTVLSALEVCSLPSSKTRRIRSQSWCIRSSLGTTSKCVRRSRPSSKCSLGNLVRLRSHTPCQQEQTHRPLPIAALFG